jgi:tetratricopeptide (TPR) repeat protein
MVHSRHMAAWVGAAVFAVAIATATAEPAPAAPTADGANAETIAKARDLKSALAAAVEFGQKAELSVEAAEAILQRTRTSTPADREAVLVAIGAPVPDEKGQFRVPMERQTEAQKKSDDERDWLEELKDAKDSPAFRDVVLDIATLRALSRSHEPKAAMVILNFGFDATGRLYRDECGRLLRRMSPYSLPALIRGSQDHALKNPDMRRYATYQLERLDRQSPKKALRDAPNDLFRIETLKAFADSQFREAVYAVMDVLDDESPQIRQAARDAWMQYATTPPKVPIPKRKLVLPGGKQSEEEVPLWLDHQQLMTEALMNELQKVRGVRPKEGTKLVDMSNDLFSYLDGKRGQALDARLDAAAKEAEAGKLDAAIAVFDSILAIDPGYARRSEMAKHYLKYGDQLTDAKKWGEASAAYGKAVSVGSPEIAQIALGKHHYARGMDLEKRGGDASTEFARAVEVNAKSGRGAETRWMLYIGIVGAFFGVFLFVLGFMRRRQFREF